MQHWKVTIFLVFFIQESIFLLYLLRIPSWQYWNSLTTLKLYERCRWTLNFDECELEHVKYFYRLNVYRTAIGYWTYFENMICGTWYINQLYKSTRSNYSGVTPLKKMPGNSRNIKSGCILYLLDMIQEKGGIPSLQFQI